MRREKIGERKSEEKDNKARDQGKRKTPPQEAKKGELVYVAKD